MTTYRKGPQYRKGHIVALVLSGWTIASPAVCAQEWLLQPRPKSFLLDPSLLDTLQAAMNATTREDWDAAAQLYREAIAIAPDRAALHNNLGVVERRRGNLTQAIAAYRQALEINPGFTEVYPNLAVALLTTEKWQEALDTLRVATASGVLEPSLPLYRAIAHEKLGQWTLAAEAYDIYVQSEPSAMAYYRGAIAHWQAGDGAAAARSFQFAARLDPAFPLYTSEAGLALAKLGVHQSAIQLLSQLPEGWSQPSDFIVLARLAHRTDMSDVAEAAIARAFAANTAVPPAWVSDAGAILSESGQLDTASLYLNRVMASPVAQRALQADPPTHASYNNGQQVSAQRALAIASANLAEIYLKQDRPALALAASQTARSLDPLLPLAHNNLGVAAIALNRPNEAAAALQAAVVLDPEYWQAHRNLGLAYAHLGNRANARQHILNAMDAAPTLERKQQLNRELLQLKRRELPRFQTDAARVRTENETDSATAESTAAEVSSPQE